MKGGTVSSQKPVKRYTILEDAMPFQPVPFGMRVSMEFTKNLQLVVNVYHVISNDPLLTANLTAIGTVFVNWWSSSLRATQANALVLNNVVVTALDVEEGLQVTVAGGGVAGSLAGIDTPNNVAVVASHRTGYAGRTRRGRTYLAGIVSTEVSNDVVPGSRATSFVSSYNALRASLVGANAYLAVVSYTFNGVPRPAGIATGITTTVVDTRVDTQRRRLTGTGA